MIAKDLVETIYEASNLPKVRLQIYHSPHCNAVECSKESFLSDTSVESIYQNSKVASWFTVTEQDTRWIHILLEDESED